MKRIRLNNPLQVVKLGGTLGFEITSADLKPYTEENEPATLALAYAPAGSLIRRVRIVLVKPFNPVSWGTGLTVRIGVNGDEWNLFPYFPLIQSGTPSPAPMMFEMANIVSSDTDSLVTITFDIVDPEGGSLSQVTGGVLRVYVDQAVFETEKYSNF